MHIREEAVQPSIQEASTGFGKDRCHHSRAMFCDLEIKIREEEESAFGDVCQDSGMEM